VPCRFRQKPHRWCSARARCRRCSKFLTCWFAKCSKSCLKIAPIYGARVERLQVGYSLTELNPGLSGLCNYTVDAGSWISPGARVGMSIAGRVGENLFAGGVTPDPTGVAFLRDDAVAYRWAREAEPEGENWVSVLASSFKETAEILTQKRDTVIRLATALNAAGDMTETEIAPILGPFRPLARGSPPPKPAPIVTTYRAEDAPVFIDRIDGYILPARRA